MIGWFRASKLNCFNWIRSYSNGLPLYVWFLPVLYWLCETLILLQHTIFNRSNRFRPPTRKVSLTDSENTQYKDYMYDHDMRHRPLKLKKKFYEFYTAPITKFWADSVSLALSPFQLSVINLNLIMLPPFWNHCRWRTCSFWCCLRTRCWSGWRPTRAGRKRTR